MNEHDDLTQRLGALGDAPLADAVRDQHLHAMRAASPSPSPAARRRGFGRVAVAGAAIAGFVLGSTGFAMAGALPGPAQGIAHDVLSVVQVDIPDRPKNRGACVSAAAKAGDQEAKKGCAKGRAEDVPGKGKGRSDEAPGRPAEAGAHPNAELGDCKGKPAWAGEKRKATPQERAARAACPDDDGGVEERETEEIETEEIEEQRQEAPVTPAEPVQPATPAQPATPPQPPVDPADPPAAQPADPATPPDPDDVPPAGAGQPDDVPPAGS